MMASMPPCTTLQRIGSPQVLPDGTLSQRRCTLPRVTDNDRALERVVSVLRPLSPAHRGRALAAAAILLLPPEYVAAETRAVLRKIAKAEERRPYIPKSQRKKPSRG